MSKIANVENSELEAIKQMAMEIALRLNVLQGESLLSETTEVRPVSTAKRAVSEDEILVAKIVIAASFLLGLLISAACGASTNTPFWALTSAVAGMGLCAAYYKMKTRRILLGTVK